jgi:hypothetical protein
MRNKGIIGFKRFSAAILILVIVGSVSLPAQDHVAICNRALEKCGVQAVIAGIFGGLNSLGAYAAGCLIGYDFCLKYYIPLK